MGFMDKLKKAAEQAAAAGSKLIDGAKEQVEQIKYLNSEEGRKERAEKEEAARREALEAERRQVDAELETYREALRAKARRFAEMPSECDKGDCAMGYRDFCYTCPEDCACRRKQMVDPEVQYHLDNPAYLPYAKWVEATLKEIYEKIPAGERTYSAILDATRHTRYKSNDGEYSVNVFDEIAIAFVERFFPDYAPLEVTFARALSFLFDGFGRKNKCLSFLTRAYACELDPRCFIEPFAENFLRSINSSDVSPIQEWDEEDFQFRLCRHIELDFYYNQALYRRNEGDFDYTVKALECLYSPEVFRYFFPNLEFDPEKWVRMLYDENGDLKPAGRGGPEQGEWGDTIWNAIEELGRLNEQQAAE